MDSRLREVEIPLGAGAFQKVRMFKDDDIQRSITEALHRISQDKRGVFVKGRVDQDGVAAVAVARLNGHWSVGVIGEYNRDKTWAIGFETAIEF